MALPRFFRSPYSCVALAVLIALCWRAWPRGGDKAAEGSADAGRAASPAAEASVPAVVPAPGRVERGEREEGRPAAERPLEPRPVAEIHKALLEQGRKAVETGAGGADAATKAELVRRTKEIEALGAGGRGFSHPASILMLAEFSRYLDAYGSFDAAMYKADMAKYFNARLKEIEALPDDAGMKALREKWERDLARDDSAEALLLRRVYGGKADTKATIERLLADLGR
ncbi:hypothetical protein [Luteolibacter soli]|uniref:Uncharacterized protein n=1 Tax=Luteolibacter soli TaxID=3135280 RepID=A0ABU9AV62_9BACT